MQVHQIKVSPVDGSKMTIFKPFYDIFKNSEERVTLKIRLGYLKKNNQKIFKEELTAGQIARNYPELYEELTKDL